MNRYSAAGEHRSNSTVFANISIGRLLAILLTQMKNLQVPRLHEVHRDSVGLHFLCHHSNLGRVVTIGGRSYRVCCDCAATFDDSIDTISIRRRSLSPVQALCVVRLNSAQ